MKGKKNEKKNLTDIHISVLSEKNIVYYSTIYFLY